MQFSLTTVLALVASALAAPAELQPRAAAVCGSVSYTATQTNQASVAACNYVRAGDTAGSSTYPHRYNNYEGFDFKGLSGPFYEFPIMSSGSVYSGGMCLPSTAQSWLVLCVFENLEELHANSSFSQARPVRTVWSSLGAAPRPALLPTPVRVETTLLLAEALPNNGLTIVHQF
jgi:hypothetical protein